MNKGKPAPSTSSATLGDMQDTRSRRAGRLPAAALEKRAPNDRVADRLPLKLPPGKKGDKLHALIVEERRSRKWGPTHTPASPTRDALIALQYGQLAGALPTVVARIKRALENEDDPLHPMVMEKMIARVMPQAFWDRLGTKEFDNPDSNKGVTVVVNVQQAETPPSVVIDAPPTNG